MTASSMYPLREFIIGIFIIHVALAFVYVLGSIIRHPTKDGTAQLSPAIEIPLRAGLGAAAIGFLTFFVGVASLFSPIGFAIVVALVIACGTWTQQRLWTGRFWVLCLRPLGAAARNCGFWLVWLVAIVLAFPAAQPPTAFDAIFFHQVYALEWAQHHAIYVDVYRRFPWYAQNWILIYTWFDVFGWRDFVQFINWASEALAAVLVFGLTREALPTRSILADLAAGLSPLPFLLAPVFLRWTDTGMVDASLAFFFLIGVVVTVKKVISTDETISWLEPALIAGFFIGMKPTFFVFAALFAPILAVAMRRHAESWRRIAVALFALSLVACPWYLKNIVQDGDPVPPLFNYLLHRTDGTYSRTDVEAISSASFGTGRSPRDLALLPFRMFLAPTDADFQEFGTSAEVLLLGVPFVILTYGLWRRRNSEIVYWSAALAFAYAYWIYSSHLGRYAMLFYPLLTALNARLIVACAMRLAGHLQIRGGSLVAAISALGSLLLAIPTPASADWLRFQYQFSYANAGTTFANRDVFLRHFPGYAEEELVANWLAKHPSLPARVLSFRLESLSYYFAEHNIKSIGDWIGPARYSDFASAVSAGQASTYVHRLDVAAVIIPQRNGVLSDPEVRSAVAQLERAGFRQIPDNGEMTVLVRSR